LGHYSFPAHWFVRHLAYGNPVRDFPSSLHGVTAEVLAIPPIFLIVDGGISSIFPILIAKLFCQFFLSD